MCVILCEMSELPIEYFIELDLNRTPKRATSYIFLFIFRVIKWFSKVVEIKFIFS